MEPRRPRIILRRGFSIFPLLVAIFAYRPLVCFARPCDLSVIQNGKLYNYSLATPSPKHPHGVLSEDGFYKDCGGLLRCGTQCSALVSNDVGGYPVCSSIGLASDQHIALIDKRYPNKGVKVTISTNGPKSCNLSVSVFCDPNGAKGPDSLDVIGTCNYATSLRHPSGCAKIVSSGGGAGWFGTLIIMILCLLLAYLLAGVVYRYYFLGIRGLDAIPNLEVWLSLPERAKALLGLLLRRVRGQSHRSRSSYASIS